MTCIRLSGVTKRYGETEVITGLDLGIQSGEFLVFLGPSGCGKSTLLRMITGLETVSDGQISIGDRRVNEQPPGKRGVAMVFQHYALYPHMTVYDDKAFGLRNTSVSTGEGAIVYMGGRPKEKMPGFASYATRYKARFGEDPITYSPYSYDGTMALLTAMKDANSTDPKVYGPYLDKLSIKGVSAASISYDSTGDLKDAPVTIYKVQHGDFKPVDTIAGN